jgi:hypothetical protein
MPVIDRTSRSTGNAPSRRSITTGLGTPRPNAPYPSLGVATPAEAMSTTGYDPSSTASSIACPASRTASPAPAAAQVPNRTDTPRSWPSSRNATGVPAPASPTSSGSVGGSNTTPSAGGGTARVGWPTPVTRTSRRAANGATVAPPCTAGTNPTRCR